MTSKSRRKEKEIEYKRRNKNITGTNDRWGWTHDSRFAKPPGQHYEFGIELGYFNPVKVLQTEVSLNWTVYKINVEWVCQS